MKPQEYISMRAKEYNDFARWVKQNTRMHSPRLFDAAKMVLVKGVPQATAAREVGATPQSINYAVKKLSKLHADYKKQMARAA